MWERRPDDADFARVRIGLSSQRLSTPLVMPDLGPAEERDPVTAMELRRLFRRRAMVPDLPVPLALREIASIEVSGDLGAARSMLRAVICQLTLTHGPEDLRIAAVVNPLTAVEWDWLKWLPHHQHPHVTDDGGPARLTYTTLSSAESALENCVAHHAVLFVDGGLVTGTESLLTSGSNPCVTVVDIGTASSGIAALRLVVAGDALIVRSEADEEVSARPDTMTKGHALAYARRMSRYQQAARDTAVSTRVSPSISWPELMGIADVGAVDPAVIWRSTRAPERMLRVPIGVSEHGRPVDLDIKEAATNGMGPHGLCIGATGSGKSEFLRTLALGMIAAHPPDTLNLVLVDFKGGASFLGFERAPHVAAVITNLAAEAHLVARMKDALAGEMTRRQQLLRAAGNFANIAEYRRARAERTRLAPLPALFIVVDEFSELLTHHPDFIDLFIAIGRLGRSLGMHLLLASQRMDEGRLRGLESHLSYRVCLKTFSASESRAVLGVPDAYHLPNAPGSAYLKTGAGDPLRFQSAFVSGPCGLEGRSGGLAAVPAPMLFTAAPVGRTTHGDEQQVERGPRTIPNRARHRSRSNRGLRVSCISSVVATALRVSGARSDWTAVALRFRSPCR